MLNKFCFLSRTLHLRPRLFLLSCLLFLPFLARTQVEGTVFDPDNYPLAGATVKWLDGPGTTVDLDGNFRLEAHGDARIFAISYLGYATLEVNTEEEAGPYVLVLQEAGTTLGEVNVTARDNGNSASILNARNVESITSKELRKAPCCSLAESFENSPVVDLTYGDPLTGRREIQMLGLRGNYTQLTLEKRPMLDGLASPFALDLIPGPWVQGIQIGKGSGSLESGAQGMTGEINTELIKPTTGPQLFLNGFAGTQGRGEMNVVTNHQISETLHLGAAAHGSFTGNDFDHDRDGFEDMPDRETAVGLLRLFRAGNDNWEGQWNVLGALDKRRGGQLESESTNPYLINQNNQRLEAWGKTGYFGFNKPHQSVGLIYSTSLHDLNNTYGEKDHTATQRSFYLNGLYHTQIVNDKHQLSIGGTARSDQFQGVFNLQSVNRQESTVGTFGEYTFHWENEREGAERKAFTAILGLRADRHNLGGNQLSPRMNLKYNPSERTAYRLSAGRGWRSPNALVDNINWLPSSRRLVLAGNDEIRRENPGFLGLESAWNIGGNVTKNIRVNERELQVVLDFYHTSFTDQLIIDAEQDATTLNIYQLEGNSRANSLMLSGNYELFPLVDVKLAYKYNDVQQTYASGELREVPLTARHRALATIGYDGARFKAHLNYNWTGPQRLIDFDNIPESVNVSQPQRSPGFGLLNTQFTYVVNTRTQIYLGGENLTNNRQARAIIGADAPLTGAYFDATQVYKPIFGIRGFVGFRYTVE